ncbi:MAG: energy-coupling factor ABC transporter permease [Lentisphaerae bacterium]|nr:energy-coupling factor ABC transporter permease [Lentisphaerota bacterium]
MHMADALLSPAVGGVFWLASAGLIGYSSRKITEEKEQVSVKTPLMGVMGAFIFAAQMINFSIPGTGSSGHLGGGLILAAMLGPSRAFITLASVLVIQCLFFADGGLLALGCNIFNLAFFPAFIAYPFIYKVIAGKSLNSGRLAIASITAAEAGLLMGAFSVVVQTTLSGISDLPFGTFILFMMPIHFAIGIVEGLATWGVLQFVAKTQPALLADTGKTSSPAILIATFAVAAIALGGFISWFASSRPDGLEWSMAKVSGVEELANAGDKIHRLTAEIQNKLAFFPDYSLGQGSDKGGLASSSTVKIGTTIAGIIGGVLVFAVAGVLGILLRKKKENGNAGGEVP